MSNDEHYFPELQSYSVNAVTQVTPKTMQPSLSKNKEESNATKPLHQTSEFEEVKDMRTSGFYMTPTNNPTTLASWQMYKNPAAPPLPEKLKPTYSARIRKL